MGYRFSTRSPGIALVRFVRESSPGYADLDTIEELGDEIATLAAHIHAATQRLLTLIAEFDRRGGWELDGHRSCAHWLAFRTGIVRAWKRSGREDEAARERERWESRRFSVVPTTTACTTSVASSRPRSARC
jgi:hypothetical protein